MARTGRGQCLVDRWPDPRTVVAEVAGNYSLRGDPTHLDDQPELIAGFVEAPEAFLTELRRLDPHLHIWERVIHELNGDLRCPPAPAAIVRRLAAPDAGALAGLAEGISWVSKTLGGPARLAASELACGAFCDGQLVSVAVPFFLGEDYEDLGVVTERDFRGRGLSAACAAAVVADIHSRRRRPTWTTSLNNVASLGVARRLGFRPVREDRLYIVRTSVPEPDG
jgi:GNAT superfamily N-acetyltransferase